MSQYHANCTKSANFKENESKDNSCPAMRNQVCKSCSQGMTPLNLTKKDSLLEVISKERDCSCEVMARALRSNYQVHITPEDRAAATNGEANPKSQNSERQD